MEPSVDSFIAVLTDTVFGGSGTLCGLALLLGSWIVFLVILANIKAPILYNIVPLIPLCIFFNSLGILNTDVMMITVLLCSVVVATELKRPVMG